MQICKTNLVSALIVLAGAAFVYGQSIEMPAMPSMPEITTEITMPEISSSSGFGKGFYVPSMPSGKSSDSKNQTAASSSTGTTSVLQSGTTSDDLINQYLNNSSSLTASDISTLYDSGLFGSLSSLSGNYASLLGGVTGTEDTSSTQVMLQQILNSLDDLKTQQKQSSAAQKENLEQLQKDSETFKSREPSILRFKINGYDINDSLTTVFFSNPEPDGSFLLTADRKYYTNQKARTETFYVLFKAVRNSGSNTTYEVQPSIVQDSKNENSFVYKMCHLKNLTAEKTGNLVVLKEAGNLNVDMLLDIDK